MLRFYKRSLNICLQLVFSDVVITFGDNCISLPDREFLGHSCISCSPFFGFSVGKNTDAVEIKLSSL